MDSAYRPHVTTYLTSPLNRSDFSMASVIVGCDRSIPGHHTVFYGRTELEKVAKLGRGGGRALTLTYDSRNDSLEYFVAACWVLKGSCDYRSAADDAHFLALMKESWEGSSGTPDGEVGHD